MSGIVLDTCVISEPKRAEPDSRVLAWLKASPANTLFLTATIVGEISAGVECMPLGNRRIAHEAWLRRLLTHTFAGRVLAFDVEAAKVYGQLIALARTQGRPSQVADAQIAAVALRHGMAVATRNVRDFEVFGVPLVNPWEAA